MIRDIHIFELDDNELALVEDFLQSQELYYNVEDEEF